jgi:hypothetical protein
LFFLARGEVDVLDWVGVYGQGGLGAGEPVGVGALGLQGFEAEAAGRVGGYGTFRAGLGWGGTRVVLVSAVGGAEVQEPLLDVAEVFGAPLDVHVSTTTVAPTIYEKAVVQEIPGKSQLISAESRIEYIPIERRHNEYDQIERVEQVPVQSVITEYQEVKRQQTVPVERVVQDDYTVEYQTEHVPRVVEEKVIDYVQQEKVSERVEYVPYER